MFKRYFLAGLVFQSVVIGGGYATGRELVEFFLASGPWGGILGMLVSMSVWSAILMVTFELARQTRSFDYRSLFKHLLGRWWFLYEAGYVVLLILIFSVLGAASGTILSESFGFPVHVGTLLLIGTVVTLVVFGSDIIERFLASWSFLLYAVYVVFLILVFASFGNQIASAFEASTIGDGWIEAGVTYAGYNVAVIPAVIFCVRHHETRKDSLISGLLAGPLAIIPGVLFYFTMMSHFPEIGERPVPANFLLEQIKLPVFHLIFQLVVFGTFVETGIALVHGVNERLAAVLSGRGESMPKIARAISALIMFATAIYAAAAVGLVDLIAKGYTAMTYYFIVILVVPMLSIGLWKITYRRRILSMR